jgi:DNA (cytosine-5)-methyltransferase 1
MRCATNGKYPKFAVWENVTGAYSSNDGDDFKCVLEELCKVKEPDVSIPKPAKWAKAGKILGNDYSIAWRTVDAQYWNIPQRRVRIYLVADFDGGCASQILFESEGLSGYSAESFRAWQAASRSAENCSGTAGTSLVFSNHGQDTRFKGPVDVAETISASYGTGGNNQPFVVKSAGFCTEHSAKARGIGYEEEISPTLRTGVVPATLKIRCGGGNGGRGALIQEDKSATLSCNNDQTLFIPKAYGICSKHSNSMMSDNPNSGFYEAETARTIDTSNQSPCKNQGGMVVIEGNGSRPSHHGDGYKESETMYTLNCTENHAVSYGIGRPAMNQSFKAKFSFQIEEEKSPTIVASGAGGVSHPKYSTSKSSHHTIAEKEKANTLVASDYKDPPLVNDSTSEIEYIVRRLTPQECALLQGMPTWWCDGLETENPTEKEINWWANVFETYNKAIGKETKPKSRNQIIKWLKNPYSDSAAYKMWGNGIFMGHGWFVLAGIAHYAGIDSE